MQIVIDIPEHCIVELNNIELNELNEGVVFHTICCVRNGIPLEPQPKTGHWIDKFAGVYRCSCCREIIEIDIEIEHPNGITFNYCPNCGCKMTESQESEE